MEVSNEIKEDIRKTQTDLKHAIRVHQIWVARLQEDENNIHLKTKVEEAEKDIVAIGQAQKLVVDRLRRELEMYQQRLKARNRQINIENDNHYVAQQLREHQNYYRNRNRSISLLKPSVLNEIHIKAENTNGEVKEDMSDSESEVKSSNEKEYSNHSEVIDKYHSYSQPMTTMHDSRNKFANALNKVKQSFISSTQHNDWHDQHSDSESSGVEFSPTPSPPPLPQCGETISQEVFMRQAEFSYSRLIGLVTPAQKEILDKRRSERRKRSAGRTNHAEFIYTNFEMMPKRKKLNQFPYLQAHTDPPQTRSAKLRKQQMTTDMNKSREGSPSGSSSENNREAKGWSSNNKPVWLTSLPASLSVEPVTTPAKKVCHGCGRSDVQSLLVRCGCGVWTHTGCAAGAACPRCRAPLPDPAQPLPAPASPPHPTRNHYMHCAERLAELKRLQEKNIELCMELRKLETRAAILQDSLDENNDEKRQLLANQIRIQRNLQKLLDFVSYFKETSISLQFTTLSEAGSENSKSNEE